MAQADQQMLEAWIGADVAAAVDDVTSGRYPTDRPRDYHRRDSRALAEDLLAQAAQSEDPMTLSTTAQELLTIKMRA